MNKVIITGKIKRITILDKVIYATVTTYKKGEYEYIPVTIFSVEFFKKHFYEGKWVSIEGHIHVNKQNEKYITEIIADDILYCGEKTETDDLIQQVNALNTQ